MGLMDTLKDGAKKYGVPAIGALAGATGVGAAVGALSGKKEPEKTSDGMMKSHTEDTTKKVFKKAKEDFGAFKAAQVVKQKGEEIEKNLSE